MQTITATDRIVALAESFQVLRGKSGVNPWDPIMLDRWASGGASHGERLAASFVLHVWNQWTEWRVGRFDLCEALNTWDAGNRAAFVAWAQRPFFL